MKISEIFGFGYYEIVDEFAPFHAITEYRPIATHITLFLSKITFFLHTTQEYNP